MDQRKVWNQIPRAKTRSHTTSWRNRIKFSYRPEKEKIAHLSGLYNQTCECCGGAINYGLPIINLSARVKLAYKAKDVIAEAKSGTPLISDLYTHYSSSLRKGINSVFFEDSSDGLSNRLSANVSRFAAYKAHYATNILSNILSDPQIPEADREKYAKEALKTFDRWHDAEYSTTVARSRTAKQFTEFNHPDRVRLFPNLIWLPSRSVNVRVAHTAFYNRVWAKNDPFWASNSPGTEWNCKCDVEETEDKLTDNGSVPNVEAPEGLEGNPAFTGEVFTENASYIKRSSPFKLDENTGNKFKNLQALVNTDAEKWRIDYYSDNGGFLTANRARIKDGELNVETAAIVQKELSMCQTLAVNGHKVIYRETVSGSFDIFLDDIPADLKKTTGARNIWRYANKAINTQGAKVVVFEFEKFGSDFINVLQKLTKNDIHGYFYVTGDVKIRTF